jgi:hypothetical protein
MILTADTSQMDDELKVAHIFYLDMILQEISVRRAGSDGIGSSKIGIGVINYGGDNSFDAGRTTQ